MRYYCTYFDSSYFAKGLALYRSMKKHCWPFRLYVLALDDRCAADLQGYGDMTVYPMSSFMEDHPILALLQEKRTKHEFIWSLTGLWMLDVLKFDATIEELNYIDADCFFYSSPEPVYHEIGGEQIAVTPHRFSPKFGDYGKEVGNFNVGLVHIKRTPRGMGCITQWATDVLEWCYWRHEIVRGRAQYCDQKYLDYWGEDWGAYSIEHKGANLAPWNQAGQYNYVQDGQDLFVNDDRLIWYHFHKGLEPGYGLDPRIKSFVYGRYAEALGG